jgi:hypothetical protein
MSGNGGGGAARGGDSAESEESKFKKLIETLTAKAKAQIDAEKEKTEQQRNAETIRETHKEMIRSFADVLDKVENSKVIEDLTRQLLASACDVELPDPAQALAGVSSSQLKELTEAKAVVKTHQDLTSIPKELEQYSRYNHALATISCGTAMFGPNALMADTYDNRLKQFLIAQLITKWLNSPQILLLVERCYSPSSKLSVNQYETIIDFLDRLAAFGCRKIIEKDRTTPLISKVADCMVLALKSITVHSFTKESAILIVSAIVIDSVTPGLLGASYKALKYGVPGFILTVRLLCGDPLASVAAVNVVVKPQYIAKCIEWSAESMHSFVTGQVGQQVFSPELVANAQGVMDRTEARKQQQEDSTRARHGQYPERGTGELVRPPPSHIVEMRANEGCDPLDRLNRVVFELPLADVPFFNESRWIGFVANKIIRRLSVLFRGVAIVPGEMRRMVKDTKTSVSSVDKFFTNLKSRLQSSGANPLTKDMEFHILQELSANKETILLSIEQIEGLGINFENVLDGFIHDKAFVCGVVKESVLRVFAATTFLIKGPTYAATKRHASISPARADAADSLYQENIDDMGIPVFRSDELDRGTLESREPLQFPDLGPPLEHLGFLSPADFRGWSMKSGEDAASSRPGGAFEAFGWFGKSFKHWEDSIRHPDVQPSALVDHSSQTALLKRIKDLEKVEKLPAVQLMRNAEAIEERVEASIESGDDDDDSYDPDGDDGADGADGDDVGSKRNKGGKRRSRRNSAEISKRTRRRKATTKKQKSKKNKRQSRRKVRRSSSRKAGRK